MWVSDSTALPNLSEERVFTSQKIVIDKITKDQDSLLANQETALTLFNLLEENFSSDTNFLGIFTLANRLKNINDIGLYTITTDNLLQEEYRNINGQSIYILYPKVGEENYTEINNFVDEIINS